MKVRRLKNKDFLDVYSLIQSCRDFSNFYITKDNVRSQIKNYNVVKKIINDCTKWNEILYGYFQDGELTAIALIIGFREKTRKYIKILSKEENFKILDDLIRVLFWNHGMETYIKVKKDSKILVAVLKKNKFEFLGDRGREVLLKRNKYEIKRLDRENDGRDNYIDKSNNSRPRGER